ncbi:uncharacterized protein LOC121770213 isoform X3 [Salvia splendens]|uniref:uncharacterized protein LOC121770213 isoform X3 n=1 Tax=Salvia splendens TaxID=180675 RepID=UPI001C2576D5|nr:uncharacterized protein LOC121770213 isoform X3 [Salvia splendens]
MQNECYNSLKLVSCCCFIVDTLYLKKHLNQEHIYQDPDHMDRSIALHSLAALLLLVLYPKAECQWLHHHPLPPSHRPPLCAEQFALANGACSGLPYTPLPPPTPPAPPAPIPTEGDHPLHRHGGHHNHGHRHHMHKETSAEADCCRWLKQVDNICICSLLVHLPEFLARPAHNYTVYVDESCEISFSCPSRCVPF